MNLFELFIKIRVDDQASAQLAKIGQSLGNGLSTAAKIGVAAVGAASSAIVALTSQAINSFAEYEQLVGGAQKIFDQIDYSQIATDASNAYIDMGLSASQYLAVMNDVGATFAATMGDQAGYDTARIGLQAISDYASGTGKSVDFLSEKFALITRSTSSYQSIADQFAGLLPATSAAFLEQAQAAGFLSDEYTELTQVPLDEYQSAIALMLAQGVSNMNLAGNAAAEATNTISGSLAMAKAAWNNLVTGLADDSADMELLFGKFAKSVSAVAKNIVPAIVTALKSSAKLIKDFAPQIAEQLPALMEEILPSLAEATASLIVALAEQIPEMAGALVDAAIQIVDEIGNAFAEKIPGLSFIFQNLETVIISLTAAFVAYKAATAISGVIDALRTATEGQTLAQTLLNAVMNANPFVLVATLIAGLVAAVITLWNTNEGFRNAVISAWQAIKTSAVNIFSAVANVFTQTIPNALNSIINWCRNLGTKFAEVGKNIVDGLKRGISNAWRSLKTWFTNLFGDLTSIAKRILGIASPSKVFKKIGLQTAQGYQIGFDDEFAKVKDDMEDALNFDDASVGINASIRKVGAGAAGMGYGGTSIGNITINIDGAKYSDEQSLASAIAFEIQNMTDRRAAVYA